MASPKSTTASLPHTITAMEAKHYYYGLYSKPILVARTGNDTWEVPTGPEAYLQPKELRTVGNHPLKHVWEDNLSFQIHNILESKGVKWTSTDVARIGFVGESIAPVVVWIGVKPDTLSAKDGLAVATECKQLLVANKILDVEVEIRESVVTRYVGPQLLKPVRSIYPTASLLEPLTPTLGPFICSTKTPWAEGTGGFYVIDSNSELYLVTARHVIFKPDITNNETYERKFNSEPQVNVALLGATAFTNYLAQIKHEIEERRMIIEYKERQAREAKEDRENNGGMKLEETVLICAEAEKLITEANNAILAFQKLYAEVERDWGNMDNRVLGYVCFAPPIEVGTYPKGYTQDYALIKIDRSKINSTNFTGNAIDLGTHIPHYEFTRLMFPNPINRHNFKYPTDRLLKVRGIVTDEEMRSPTILDENGDPCLLVMKRGNTTGLTLGRANDIISFVRNYFDTGETKTSKEWAIYPYDNRSGPFSHEGDSGSAIVDCLGRLGGLLTGGSGSTDSSDITYATPISFIIDSLNANGYRVTTEAALTVEPS
ncbi:hypothetical protein HOY82DRAFT_652199 [Tuber indicum]|nr:hypothetical protein HOY82DRAFT_652199 [Tuber indicum]